MDRLGEIPNFTAHFESQDSFRNQLAGAGPYDPAAQHAVGLGIDEPFGQAVGSTQRLSTAAGRPWIHGDFILAAGCFGVFFGESSPGDFRIRKYHRRDSGRMEFSSSAEYRLDRDFRLVGRLVGQHWLTDDVADLGMAFIIMAPRRIAEAERHLRAGKWKQARMDLGTNVRGKKLGIVGLGRVGSALAKRAEGFGLDIGFHDIVEKDVPYRRYPDLLSLAEDSDILFVSCQGGESTRNLINAEVFDALGPKGFLVNVARGTIVDEDALVAALQDKRIAGAAVDVFRDEPNAPEALMATENIVMTPHIASSTHETRRAMADLVLANLRAHFAGEPVPTPVPDQR